MRKTNRKTNNHRAINLISHNDGTPSLSSFPTIFIWKLGGPDNIYIARLSWLLVIVYQNKLLISRNVNAKKSALKIINEALRLSR